MDSMGDALDASVGTVSELAGLVQALSDNAGLVLAVVTVALLLVVILAELLLPEQRARRTN